MNPDRSDSIQGGSKASLGPYIERETHYEPGIYLKCEKMKASKSGARRKRV